ncbi:hypothetical protein A9Q86_11170 [Flavobacteriales bacterium 33_180_T64]|nr:hypothetical protein A9Q86_11170 [Flavobacteriales bacterium 33_180_T64]
MKKIWLVFFCFTLLFNCENSKPKTLNLISLVPEDTEILIKINSSEGLENGLKNNQLIKELDNYSQIENLKSLITPFISVNKNSSLIALSRNTNDSLDFSFIIPFSKNTNTLDAISSLRIDSSFSSKENISKLLYNNSSFYYRITDSILFISNTLQKTENSLLQKTENSEIEAIYNTSDNRKMTSIFINHKNGKSSPTAFTDASLQNQKFSDYTMLDSDISQNSIFFNGITKALDSTGSLINVFKNTIPQENQIATIIPSDIQHFKSITFNNYEIINQNLVRHKLQDSTNITSVFQNIVEIGFIKTKDNDALILRSIDPSSTFNEINQVLNNEYRGVNIYSINDDAKPFLNSLAPLISIATANYFITIDTFFIFSNDIAFLESIISNAQNDTVLSKKDSYKHLKRHLSDEASMLIYANSVEVNSILNSNFTDDKKLNISNYKSSAVQYIYETDFAHVNAVLKTYKNKGTNNSVNEDINISLDAELITSPQLVKNHTNKQMDIIVQDATNTIYLVSNQGKVFWKKKIDGKVIGKINQIDSYKNGRLQLVFNTSKQLYVLDRNGKDVAPFPLKFNNEITQPVSVFDYDKKKNYRLLITQGASISMYDKKGEIVTGFKYKSTNKVLSSQPKHFRIGRKDHIVFSHGNELEILDRVGKTRIKVKEKISFSENEIYLYKNKFTTSNTNGELLEINQNGSVSHKNLNANSEHKIATTSKTLVVMNENKLTIKSNTIELDFGNYTAPKIFYINDKIYVTVTDLQSKKGYLFDSQAKSISNFPVYANSELELDNIDNDRALEVITKGDNNAIIIYEIQ